eukprot:TRINITY_DN50889_c0_g1_i1.p1 TRINITY_DN50889_c0_g1~~TRINITY_DN50889_c0_g1_i1.p1  ORF type:complete len:302 (-),score=53.11 TRINITY_DN50889_c0_g1_i1:363-1268(-)
MIEIGLCGGMGAGKTTIADLLARSHGYRRLSFADPIRHMSVAMLKRPVAKKTDRAFLQRLGASARTEKWRFLDTTNPVRRREGASALASHLFPADAAWVDPDSSHEERLAVLYRLLYGCDINTGQADPEYTPGMISESIFAPDWGDELYWLGRWQVEYQKHRRAGAMHSSSNDAATPADADAVSASAFTPIAVDDVRFPAEGDMLAGRGFAVVRLDVPLKERRTRIIARDGAWNDAWVQDVSELSVEQIPIIAAVDATQPPEAVMDAVLREVYAFTERSGREEAREALLQAVPSLRPTPAA